MHGSVEKAVEKILADLRRGVYQVLILKLLLEKGPLHGYALRQELARATSGVLTPGESTVYEALKKLEKLGLIEGFWAESPMGAPMRKYYQARPEARIVVERASELLKLMYELISSGRGG